MRIATWNVNSIKARLRYVLGWLEQRQPDLVCLQELKVADDKFPFEAFAGAGYHAAVHGQPQYNGVAVLTRGAAPTVLERGLPGAEAAGARLLTVRYGELTAASVYVPNGKHLEHEDYAVKLDFLARLRAYVEQSWDLARGRYVLGGDFNLVPDDRDTHDPERLGGSLHHSQAERARLGALTELGLQDLYRVKNPDGRMFSWWDYRAGAFHKNLGLRIDLLLASRALAEAVGEVWIDRDYRKKQQGETPSDHAPVIAELEP